MTNLAGFTPETIALIWAASAAYFLMGWAPAIWPFLATHKQRNEFPRRWLFITVVFSLAYGVLVAFLTLVTIPITAYGVFVVPQLSASGVHMFDSLVAANGFVANYWWLLLPPALLLNSYLLVRKLLPIWPAMCQVLAANNSFEPNPLRGSA